MIRINCLTIDRDTDAQGEDFVEYEPGQTELYMVTNALIETYLPLVETLISEALTSCTLEIDYDDLLSVGSFGVTEAIKDYDQDGEEDFEIFCSSRIRQALCDAIRYASWTAHCAGHGPTKSMN